MSIQIAFRPVYPIFRLFHFLFCLVLAGRLEPVIPVCLSGHKLRIQPIVPVVCCCCCLLFPYFASCRSPLSFGIFSQLLAVSLKGLPTLPLQIREDAGITSHLALGQKVAVLDSTPSIG
ncbi:hypothetical protein J3E68DRAFT_414973 [Trichoderma sp. SZMC 28012]